MNLPPAFSWPRYWTYQRGVARIAQIICRDLEFNSLESVTIISLARDLCQHNRVGASGDPVRADAMAIEATAKWRILRESVYPSFNLQKFERAIHAHSEQWRTEFSGHQAGNVREIAAHAAVV